MAAEQRMVSKAFRKRFLLLIVLAWVIPAVFGLSFILYIDLLTVPQMLAVMTAPLEPLFIVISLVVALVYFCRFTRPICLYLDEGGSIPAMRAMQRVRAFPLHFWVLFLVYLLLAPATVIFAAESASDFVATPIVWFRIHLVALIVSIIVGLPIFFLVFDLFGRALSGVRLRHPVLTIRTKVFLIGALVPLLVDTMLVQYYWTRTGYFSFETFLVWVFLQILAVIGATMFMRSFGQSLKPLATVVEGKLGLLEERPKLYARSLDELGVLVGRYQSLMEQVYFHGKSLQVGNYLLRRGATSASVEDAFAQLLDICCEALDADLAFLLLADEESQELVGVMHTGAPYDVRGHYRIPFSANALSTFVYKEGRLTAISDVDNDPRVSREIIERFGVSASIAAPLVVEDKVIGVLVAAEKEHRREYTQEDRILMEALAKEGANIVHTQLLQQRRQQAEARFREADEFARVTLQSIGDGVIATDREGRVEYVNPVAQQMTGWPVSEAKGQPLSQVLRLLTESGEELAEDPVAQCLHHASPFTLPGQVLMLNREGSHEFAVDVRVSPIRAAGEQTRGVVLVFHDTTELTMLTHRLSYQASHDALTGLVNRHEFEVRLELALDTCRHDNLEHALCYMDLDRFKVVNDTCGHVAGDELLKQLGARLRASIREADTIARLGGDEFGLLLEGCHLEKAKQVAQHILEMVQDFRFVWGDKSFSVGISIGLVSIGANSGDLTDVLSAADSACYAAKDQGRNRVHIFEPNDLALVHQRGEMQWLQRIRQALEQNHFRLYAQPIKALVGDDEGHHSEVLLRLASDDGGVIAPNSFLPAAERYHLMPAIDRWVVNRALQILSACQAQGELRHFSINLSGQSLCDEQFLGFIITAIRDSGVPPEWLCFEITETTAIANLSSAVELIATLRRLGCRIALDDFGSGLSSFNYLKNLPVNYLKIDGAFVKDMDSNPIDRAMVESINQIGHLMGIETVAEFVTSEAILKVLEEIGVDYAQGYYISEPQPLEDPASA